MKSNFFTVSKPLRYLNIKNLPNFDIIPHKKLIIIDQFYGAKDFYHKVDKVDNSWEKIYFVSSVKEAYRILFFNKIDTLYTFVDCSIVLGVLYFLHHMKVVLLEEGCATYYPQTFKNPKQRRWLRKIFHVGDVLGTSIFTKQIFVYHPKVFLKNANVKCDVFAFRESMMNVIKHHKKEFFNLFLFDSLDDLPRNSKVLLYITEWNVDKKILGDMMQNKSDFDFIYVKPHPHNRNVDNLIPKDFSVLHGNIMAEFLITEFLDRGNELTIYHCGSSAVIYFMDSIKAVLYDSVDTANYEWSEMYNQLVDDLMK